MVSLMSLPQVEYPRNALLDLSPINSALENYQQSIALNRRMAMDDERLGWQRELHPLQVRQTQTATEAALENLRQSRQTHPLQLRQLQTQVQSAEETLAAQRAFRNDMGMAAGASPDAARALSLPNGPQTTAPSPPAQRTAAPARDFNTIGAQFVRDHILNVPEAEGQSRFGILLNDPVFGPAMRQHGLHEMNWRDAAQTMAGAAVTPTTRPQAAPAPAPTTTTPTAPPAEMSERERMARRMIATGIPDYVSRGTQILEAMNKLNFNEVAGRLVATDPQGRSRVVYDSSGQLDQSVVPNIVGGIRELAGIPGRYGDDAGVFTSAVGPFAGQRNDPREYFNFTRPVAQALGSLTSLWATGPNNNAPPAEVRRAIMGAQDALAAVVKGLIRKPGEGTFTEGDQALLDRIIGNLTEARDRDGYLRELENTRRRINSNFNLNLPPVEEIMRQQAGQGGVATTSSTPQAPAQATAPTRISDDVGYNALPSGTRFIGPDGKLRVKP